MRGTILAALAFIFLCLTQTAALSGDASLSPTPADGWHARALEAAESGDLAAHDAALDAAVAADPDHAPSRGERGEVWADGRWVSAEYAQHLAKTHTDRNEYLQRRVSMDNSPAAHERMAKWCERAGLREEARPHWLAVLKADPDNAAALKGIDSVWRDGRLVESEVAKKADDDSTLAARKAKEWEARLRRLERGRGPIDEEALAALREDFDQHAAAAVEARVARLGSGSAGRGQAATRQIVEAYLEASSGVSDSEMTASLCRIATLAPDEAVRAAAAEKLRLRDKFDVMPRLLVGLKSPIESRFDVQRAGGTTYVYQHTLREEGQETDREIERNHVNTIEAPDFDRLNATQQQEALFLVQMEAVRTQLKFAEEAIAIEQQVAAYNETARLSNGRTLTVLRQVVNSDKGDSPREWWDYWQRYSGYDVPYERPVDKQYQNESSVSQPYLPPPPPRCECFVAGTPVWTRDGKRAIETLRAGDLVLSRDPHRGGLVWRVVIETTVREPSPMVTVVAGNETIHATEGHPFWVVGHGWRMAKELTEGDVLSTIEGPAKVTAIEDHASERAYNLVVEGAANYYVGERGVLVHDNTPRVPAVGLVARR